MKTRDSRIILVQYIATILIVYQHSISSAFLGEVPQWLSIIQNVVTHISRCAVPIFFFFSGYLWFYKLDSNNYLKKVKRLVRTLVIPYIFWIVTTIVLYYILDYRLM